MVSIVRDLGIYLDSSLTMTVHISRTVSNCFAALREVCSVRRSLPMRVMSSLVTALLLTRLDCGNASHSGLPRCQLNRLQSVLHEAARLVCGARNYDYVTPLLQELHWLSVRIGSRSNWLHWYSGVCTASLRLTLLRLLTVQQTSTGGEG